VGARALLAFQGTYERDENGDPTDEALLGAAMESERQAAEVLLTRGFYEVFRKR